MFIFNSAEKNPQWISDNGCYNDANINQTLFFYDFMITLNFLRMYQNTIKKRFKKYSYPNNKNRPILLCS